MPFNIVKMNEPQLASFVNMIQLIKENMVWEKQVQEEFTDYNFLVFIKYHCIPETMLRTFKYNISLDYQFYYPHLQMMKLRFSDLPKVTQLLSFGYRTSTQISMIPKPEHSIIIELKQ